MEKKGFWKIQWILLASITEWQIYTTVADLFRTIEEKEISFTIQ